MGSDVSAFYYTVCYSFSSKEQCLLIFWLQSPSVGILELQKIKSVTFLTFPHHQLNGHEFEQAPRIGDGQRSLVCFSPWGCKESDTTERLN